MRQRKLALVFVAIVLLANSCSAFVNKETSMPFDHKKWLEDFQQLKKIISDTHPNLEAEVKAYSLNPSEMSKETEKELRAADSDEEAFQALTSFVKKFRDGHLRLVKRVGEKKETSTILALPKTTSGVLACKKLMDAKTKGTDFPFPTPKNLGFSDVQVQGFAFPTTTLKVKGKTIGFLRIPSFDQGNYPELCAEEWENYIAAITTDCDKNCQDKFVHEALPNRLLQELQFALKKFQQKNISALLLDITNNGGGTNWVSAVSRMVTAKPIVCGQFGFIRHPHWAKRFQEEIDELSTLLETTKYKGEKENIEIKLKELKANLRQTEVKCDRSNIWTDKAYQANCTVVAKKAVTNCSPKKEFQFITAAYRGPLLVLVNNRTASASEDLVGRLKDSQAAKIIGEHTAGSGCGHTNGGIDLKLNHSGIKVMVPDCARYLRNGQNEVLGISPDSKLSMKDFHLDGFTRELKKYLIELNL